MIEEIILKQVAEQNYKIVEIYKARVWNNYLKAIYKLNRDGHENLLQDPEFILFANDTMNFFKNSGTHASIYDAQGNKFITNSSLNLVKNSNQDDESFYSIIFSALDKYFLEKNNIPNALNQAFLGQSYHILMPKVNVVNSDNQPNKATYITSYLPIIDNDFSDFAVDGVIEINTNVTEQWQNISYLEKRVFITFIIIFSIFFGIVMYNTHYAQKIINKQFETNRALEEAKLKAENENSAKTEFLANVSHELRTPLNAIIGFSEMMVAETHGTIGNEQYKGYIHDINNSGKHLLSVINDILDFSKVSADKLKVEHVELDLNKLASSSMRFVKPRAQDARIKLIEQIPAEHIIIKADPKRLKQALLNLLSNSVKFTHEDGSVTLSIEKDLQNNLVLIKVIDTGIGISEKDIPKALSSFGQVDNKLSRKYEGTGLGLPLTKKLVELMQGKFDIQSTVGVGTTVTLTFKYEDSIEV